MVFMRKIAPFILLLMLCSCATLPTGPSVNVLPTPGKPFNTFQSEDATCRQWAQQQIGKPVQDTFDKNLATGAVAGTAVGAGLGAALGAASGHAGAGAAVGAATGLLFGSAIGSNEGQVSAREAQRRYDNAYSQCMYSYGNQVPGYRRVVSAPPPPPQVVSAPPPPPPMASVPEDYYPPAPEVYVDEAPQFIYSPDINMYVAVGVPYDIVYTGHEYFYFYGGRWYRGPYYNGPWVFVPRNAYPPIFLRFRIENIRHFRDIEFNRYQHDRAHFNGRFHRPEFHGEKRGAGHKEEHR